MQPGAHQLQPQPVERLTGTDHADPVTTAAGSEPDGMTLTSVRACNREMHQTHRFGLGSTTWACNPCDGQGPVTACQASNALRHGLSNGITDGANLLKQSFRHTQHLVLDGIGVGNHPAQKHIRRSRHSGELSTQPPTGAGLGH